MSSTYDSIENLGRNLQECQKQLHLKYTLIKDIKNNGGDTSLLIYEVEDLKATLKGFQDELKKTYEDIFPETRDVPTDFWENFLTL